MIRKFVLVAVIILCSIAALLLSAGRPTGPAKYVGYWRAVDELQTGGGPLLIRVADNDGEITVMGLPDISPPYETIGATDTKLTLRAPDPESPGNYNDLVFDVASDGATMKFVSIPVEDPGTAGIPTKFIDFARATGPEEQLGAELAAELEQQNRPPEQIIRDNAQILSQAIEGWAADHDGRYPPAQIVGVGSKLADYMEGQWPINPMSDTPMQMTAGPGNFTYSTDGATYHLAVSMPDGSTLTFP